MLKIVRLIALFILTSVADAVADPPLVLELRVRRVVDGDTLDVTSGRGLVRIELTEIDCPELDQPFGPEASKAVYDLVADKVVRVRATARNRFGQFFAFVYLSDGRLLNEELVTRGLAWWKSNNSSRPELGRLELEARSEKRGLWSDPKPVPPWDWRYQAASRTLEEADRAPPLSVPSFPVPGRGSCRPRSECCKVCTKGKACGATCIYAGYTCHVGRGCACNSSEIC